MDKIIHDKKTVLVNIKQVLENYSLDTSEEAQNTNRLIIGEVDSWIAIVESLPFGGSKVVEIMFNHTVSSMAKYVRVDPTDIEKRHNKIIIAGIGRDLSAIVEVQ